MRILWSLFLWVVLSGVVPVLPGCILLFGTKYVPVPDPMADSFVKVTEVSRATFTLADGRTYDLAGVDITGLTDEQCKAFENALREQLVGHDRFLVFPAQWYTSGGPADLKRSASYRGMYCGFRPLILFPTIKKVPPARESVALSLVARGLAKARPEFIVDEKTRLRLLNAQKRAEYEHIGIWETDLDRLETAIKKNDEATVDALLKKGVNVNGRNPREGTTPLHWTVEHNRIHLAGILLAHGAKADTPRNCQAWNTPLHFSAERGYANFIELLLKHHADTDAKNSLGQTPLMLAAANGHLAAAGLLINNGADVNARSSGWNDGWSVLHGAAHGGHPAVAALLLDRGATFDITNNKGLTPLAVVERTIRYHKTHPQISCKKHFEGMQEVRLLLLKYRKAPPAKQ